jgi:hypothetical protein
MNNSAVMASSATANPASRASHVAPELVVTTQDVLLQGLSLLFKLSDRTYCQIEESRGASIGEHYRHVVQHFECVIRSIRSGEINYEARERNHRLETDVTFAAIATCDVLRAITKYDTATLNRACGVVSTLTNLASRPSFVETTVGRELTYCIGNAIHHYRIVWQICSQIGVAVPTEFATARS